MTLIIALLIAPFALATICFAIEVLTGLPRLPIPGSQHDGGWNAVVIVPAHDEAIILPTTLPRLIEATSGQARILLVADNCSDATAAIANQLDVEVIERSDSGRRGKGFALDFARRHIQGKSPDEPCDIIVVMDADCETDSGSIGILISTCAATARPCQATNIQLPARNASPAIQLSTFAFFIKNVIRQRALQRLARRAQLLGTGMAIPWAIFAKAELATDNIVEDLKLGQELAAKGHEPLFVERALVVSRAETDQNTLSQRSRWEGGFLQNALRTGPANLGRCLRKGDVRGAWAAVHVMIPPLALLVIGDIFALLAGGIAARLFNAQPWPVIVLGCSLVVAGVGLMSAWWGGGYRFVSFGGLLSFPLYVLWKLPMYVRFIARGTPREWVRTSRDG